jgi:GTP-binding protein Era
LSAFAGKSTLVNRLLGTKISGVSSKRNTTITPQLGCFTSGAAQVLLYDTPGLVEHSVQGSPLERLKSAWATAAMADQLLFIVDAERQVRRCGQQEDAIGSERLALPWTVAGQPKWLASSVF